MNRALLIFPHQLFETHQLIDDHSHIVLIEDSHFFHDFSFHRQKIMFHRATMQAYVGLLEKRGKQIIYYEHTVCKDGLKHVFSSLKKQSITHLDYFDVIDKALGKKIVKAADDAQTSITRYDSLSFFLSAEDISLYFKNKKRYSMAPFYQYMRKRYDILVNQGRPIGGKWSFDSENRKVFDDNLRFAKNPINNRCVHVAHAKAYVKRYFSKNPGSIDSFIYPVTHTQAQKWLTHFLKTKFSSFGTYQDAIHTDHPFGFHSLLSPLLNVGLLIPQDVIAQALDYSRKHTIAINDLEGFIRQILGWREFVRGVYVVAGDEQRKRNILGHTNKLHPSFWTATTGIDPLDGAVRNALDFAYAHHIERLMIIGNFMQLAEIDPDQVYKWFMEMFIDAYDWVMVPNVYGMSQYADGGLMTTKPYCSGSSYIKKMSNYTSGKWAELWDALYWHFMYKHRKLFSSNARMGLVMALLKKMNPKKLKQHQEIAREYLE